MLVDVPLDVPLCALRHGQSASADAVSRRLVQTSSPATRSLSHLAEHASLAWVQEFSRLLRPGGIMAMTTQLRDFIGFCESFRGKVNEVPWHDGLAKSFVDVDAWYAAYDAGHYLYAPTGGGPARPSDFYGEAMIPEGYVRTRFTPFLKYVDFVADRSLLPQALIVMQKP